MTPAKAGSCGDCFVVVVMWLFFSYNPFSQCALLAVKVNSYLYKTLAFGMVGNEITFVINLLESFLGASIIF